MSKRLEIDADTSEVDVVGQLLFIVLGCWQGSDLAIFHENQKYLVLQQSNLIYKVTSVFSLPRLLLFSLSLLAFLPMTFLVQEPNSEAVMFSLPN